MPSPLYNRDPLRITMLATMGGGVFWSGTAGTLEDARKRLEELGRLLPEEDDFA